MRTSARCRLLRPRGDLGLRLRTSLPAVVQRPIPLLLHTNRASVSTLSPDRCDFARRTVSEDGEYSRLWSSWLPRTTATTTVSPLSIFAKHNVTGLARHSSKWFRSPNNRNESRMLYTTSVDIPARSSSVDEDDVSRFAHLSSEWWDERGALKPLHSLNKARVPWIRDTLGRHSSTKQDRGQSSLTGRRVLDVGCGAGLLSEPLARLGADVIGLDAGNDAVNVARNRALQDPDLKRAKIKYECGSVEQFAADNPGMVESFDAIIASEVMLFQCS